MLFSRKKNTAKKTSWLGSLGFCLAVFLTSGSTLLAQEIDQPQSDKLAEINEDNDLLGQVTNVNQLRDISPTDWSYEALRSLVDRYGCISGFPNQTYRGSQPLSRYEFAAGLNSCLNQIERLIASSDTVNQEDIALVNKLNQEFEAELASLNSRVDEVEGRTAALKDSSFSNTTKLKGEIVFNLSEAFGDEVAAGISEPVDVGEPDNPDLNAETTFGYRTRLLFASSFTGKDQLLTRLSAGSIGNSFQSVTNTAEGRVAYDGPGDNSLSAALHYSFPLLNDKLRVTAMGALADHQFYAETFDSGLNSQGKGSGAITRFGERNPIYRLGNGIASSGVGATYTLNNFLDISGGYIAPDGSNPAEERGLTGGNFSAMGQVAFKPSEQLKFGLTYIRAYDNLSDSDPAGNASFRRSFLWGGTGTNQSNLRGVGVNSPVGSNSFGAQVQFDLSPKLSLRGWGGYTDLDIKLAGENGSATVWNYSGALVLSDLLKEGNQGAIIVGAEPYLADIDANGDGNDETITNDIPIHVEASYKYQLNESISITPGAIWLVNPNQNDDNDDILIGVLRTTFGF